MKRLVACVFGRRNEKKNVIWRVLKIVWKKFEVGNYLKYLGMIISTSIIKGLKIQWFVIPDMFV